MFQTRQRCENSKTKNTYQFGFYSTRKRVLKSIIWFALTLLALSIDPANFTIFFRSKTDWKNVKNSRNKNKLCHSTFSERTNEGHSALAYNTLLVSVAFIIGKSGITQRSFYNVYCVLLIIYLVTYLQIFITVLIFLNIIYYIYVITVYLYSPLQPYIWLVGIHVFTTKYKYNTT